MFLHINLGKIQARATMEYKDVEIEFTKTQVKQILGYNKVSKKCTDSEAARKMRISKGWFSLWPDQISGPDNYRRQDIILSAIFRHNLRRRYNEVMAGGDLS
jgi:hypothetical protein